MSVCFGSLLIASSSTPTPTPTPRRGHYTRGDLLCPQDVLDAGDAGTAARSLHPQSLTQSAEETLDAGVAGTPQSVFDAVDAAPRSGVTVVNRGLRSVSDDYPRMQVSQAQSATELRDTLSLYLLLSCVASATHFYGICSIIARRLRDTCNNG